MITITKDAIERRRRIYGATFAAAIFKASKEESPGIFQLSLRDYVMIVRAHHTRNQVAMAKAAVGEIMEIRGEIMKLKRVNPGPPPKKTK